jgi:hypothetical protein
MPDRPDDLNPASDLAPFADALRRLAPQPPELSRDALLFEAGTAAARPRAFPWLWQTTTGVFAAVSFVLGAFLISPDAPRVAPDTAAPKVVYLPEPPRPQPPEAHPAPSPTKPKARASEEFTETARLLRQRRDVLRWGVDMLPESKSAAAGPSADVAARETTHWLNLPPGTFALPAAQPRKPAPKDEDDE